MATLMFNQPLETTGPLVALDPTLKPGKYRATVTLNGDAALSASVVLVVSRVARPTVPVDPPIRLPIVTPVQRQPISGPESERSGAKTATAEPPSKSPKTKRRAKVRKRTDGPQ